MVIHNEGFTLDSPVHLRDVGHATCDAHWRKGREDAIKRDASELHVGESQVSEATREMIVSI